MFHTGIGKRKSSRGGKSSTHKDGIWIMSLSYILKKHRPMVLVLILLLLLTSVFIPWPISKLVFLYMSYWLHNLVKYFNVELIADISFKIKVFIKYSKNTVTYHTEP